MRAAVQDIGVVDDARVAWARPVGWAVAAALAGSAFWFFTVLALGLENTRASIPSLAVGFAVGYSTYRATGRRGALWAQVVSTVLCVMALLVTEALVIRLQVAREYARTGQGVLDVFLPVATYWRWLNAIVVHDGLSQLFFVTSLWAAVYIPRDRSRG